MQHMTITIFSRKQQGSDYYYSYYYYYDLVGGQ